MAVMYNNEKGQSATEYVVITASLLFIVAVLFSDRLPFNFLRKINSYENRILGTINNPTP